MVSSEKEYGEKAECDETPQYNTVSPLFGADPTHKVIDARNLARRTNDPPVDARQRLALQPKTLVHRISLAQDTVCHVVAIVNLPPLIEHVVGFCRFRI